MRRRRFIMLLAGGTVAGWPLAAQAQQAGKLYRIGFLGDSPAAFAERIEAFRQGLRDLGYVEGRNIAIEYRWAEGKPERMRELAEELVRLKVDVIVVPSSIYTEAAKRATSTIPIVFLGHADPVGTGHVTSLARPGGNITGPLLGLQIQPVAVRSANEYDSAYLAIVQGRADAVLVLTTPLFIAGAQRLAELALTHKLPSVFGPRDHVEAGGLMSYWPNAVDQWRRGAIYVDKILKGANPADLPVQQPTRFELVINLKTADALGLTIPRSILALADEVIE